MQPGVVLATRVLAAKPARAAKPALAAVALRDGPMTAKRKAPAPRNDFLLYVLVASRGQAKCGRYESPPLELVDVQIFVGQFPDLLTNDARHEFWISSTDNAGLLVYDDHGIIYAYGPLDDFERSLVLQGLGRGAFEIPAPHTHHFHGEYDGMVDQLLARWEWRWSELQPGDGG